MQIRDIERMNRSQPTNQSGNNDCTANIEKTRNLSVDEIAERYVEIPITA